MDDDEYPIWCGQRKTILVVFFVCRMECLSRRCMGEQKTKTNVEILRLLWDTEGSNRDGIYDLGGDDGKEQMAQTLVLGLCFFGESSTRLDVCMCVKGNKMRIDI